MALVEELPIGNTQVKSLLALPDES